MDNYDPNMISCGKTAIQTVEITFQMWDYKKTVTTQVGGNCRGMSVLDAAVYNIYEDLPPQPPRDEQGNSTGVPYIVLEKEGAEDLTCEDDEERGEEWLRNMVVKVEITSIVPSKEKAHG